MIYRYTHKPVGRVSTRHCSTKVEPTGLKINHYSGFTLLEMVLVLFLIGLMASATLMITENVEDQAKYEDTKHRIEMMRKAIVGDPTRTVNGSPEISGFVADMGRLPECLKELLEQEKCFTSTPLDAWDIEASTGLGFGWRGPYIQVLPERNGDLRFRDGYGNPDTTISPENSGWQWFSDASNATLSVKSAGLNSIFDDGDDYPSGAISTVKPIIYERNQLLKVDILSGRIRFLDLSTAIPSINLKLVLHYPDPENQGESTSTNSDMFVIDASNAISGYSPLIKFTTGDYISMGVRTLEVLCDDDGTVFNGQCPGDTDHNTFAEIVISPSSQTTQFNLIWDIP